MCSPESVQCLSIEKKFVEQSVLLRTLRSKTGTFYSENGKVRRYYRTVTVSTVAWARGGVLILEKYSATAYVAQSVRP